MRYSLIDPNSYIQSNLVGFANIMDLVKSFSIENFIYASSSSVYGGNKKLPFKETDNVDKPISLYAATKKSNELIAHSYSHIYDIPSTCLRFFTVYGPLGRPDMAPMIFAKSILNSKPIKIFNFGKMSRDFTYIDDIAESIFRCSFKKAKSNEFLKKNENDSSLSIAPHLILNIGSKKPIKLLDFIEAIENALGIKSKMNLLPMQAGDVAKTWSDTQLLEELTGYAPKTEILDGVKKFVQWYKSYYNL